MPDLFESGFFAHKPAWHDMGLVVAHWPGNWAEARRLASLEWEYEERPVFEDDVEVDDDGPLTVYRPMAGFKRIIRSDTGKALSVVKSSYGTISVADMGPIVEAVMAQEKVEYETTVVLDEGRKLAAVIRLNQPMRVPGDPSPHYAYGAILNSCDGSSCCVVLSTNVRIVCANTYTAAEAEAARSGLRFAFRHTKNWRDRIEDAQNAVRGIRVESARWIEVASALSLLPVPAAGVERFLAEFVPMPPEGLVSDRVAHNVTEARDAIRACLESPTCEGIRGTAYGLVQAAGEYLDHVRRSRSKASMMGRQLLRPEPMKGRAVKLAREASANPNEAARPGALVMA